MDIHAYPRKVAISITWPEALQLLGMNLDGDAEPALSSLHKKIIEKLLNFSCPHLPNMIRGPRRCLPAYRKPCCFSGHRLEAKSAMAP